MKNTGQFINKSVDEQNTVIQKKYPYLTLLSYTSFEDYCEVIDTEYNETFKCRYKNLHYGRVNCPSRKKENRKKTLLEKYDVDNVCKIPGNLEKVKATNLKKYGEDNFAKTTEFKKRHSDLWVAKSQEEKEAIVKKTQTTNIEKYGVVNPMQHKEVKDKANKTIKERYGVENVSYIPEVKKKLSDSYYQNNMKEKLIQGMISKHGVENPMLIPEVKEAVISKSIQTKKDKGLIKYVFNGNTLSELIQDNLVPFTYSHMRNLIVSDPSLDIFCLDKSYTDLERKVANFLTDNNIKFLHDRSTIPTFEKKRPDFLIEDHKVIIECHGLYWHSELMGWNSTKAKKRREIFNNAGYRVISLYQDNIEKSWSICQSILGNVLKLNKSKIYARKCEVKKIENKKEGIDFLEKNHLMGKGKGGILGLYHNNELVSVLQYYNKNNISEISRFCTLLNHSIVGGFSKLLNKLKTITEAKAISTFIDLDYGTGYHLTSMGFISKNIYPSFKWTDMNNRFNRYKFPGKTGYIHNLTRIWDSGQQLWVLELN